VFVSEFEGKRFNAPNDLVFDLEGNVYFTDPMYNAPMPLPQEKTCVYFASKDGSQVKRLVDDLPNPNGILLSTDAKTLYVLPSGQSEMMAYPIESPGVIGAGRVFATLQPAPGRGGRRGRGGQNAGGADGGTLDTNGNLYITSGSGVQIFNKEGRFLGRITLPEVPANVGFGGPDRKTLYMTARTSLYSVPTEATGFVFGPEGAAATE
jgi:gluconolactonase